MNIKTKSWINAILLLITLMVNGAGAFGLINNLSQKEVSDMYPTLITPSPSTFSIWSVIYTLLIISIVVMIIKNNNSYYERAINEISFLFWLSCALNIVWIVSFSYNLIGLSTIFIFAFLIIMVLVTKRIGKIHSQKRWLLPLTFGLYSGWLFIATVVNISAWLVKIEWGRFGIAAEIWSVAILLVAVVLTALVVLNTKNAIFPIPIAWAYFGIYNAQLTTNGNTILLQSVSLIGIVLLVGVSAIQFYKNKYNIIPVVSEKNV
jgi:benzodiazapine receptor